MAHPHHEFSATELLNELAAGALAELQGAGGADAGALREEVSLLRARLADRDGPQLEAQAAAAAARHGEAGDAQSALLSSERRVEELQSLAAFGAALAHRAERRLQASRQAAREMARELRASAQVQRALQRRVDDAEEELHAARHRIEDQEAHIAALRTTLFGPPVGSAAVDSFPSDAELSAGASSPRASFSPSPSPSPIPSASPCPCPCPCPCPSEWTGLWSDSVLSEAGSSSTTSYPNLPAPPAPIPIAAPIPAPAFEAGAPREPRDRTTRRAVDTERELGAARERAGRAESALREARGEIARVGADVARVTGALQDAARRLRQVAGCEPDSRRRGDLEASRSAALQLRWPRPLYQSRDSL